MRVFTAALLLIVFSQCYALAQEIIAVSVEGISDSVRNSKQQDRDEAILDAKLKAIERAGVNIEAVTIMENFQIKKDWVEARAKAHLLPGFEIVETGYGDDDLYHVVLIGEVRIGLAEDEIVHEKEEERWFYYNEITGEVNISWLDPYDRLAPGFCGTYWPEFLQYKGLFAGAGLALNISNRFNYETTLAEPIEGYPNWYYFEERLIELVNFDFFLAGRWQFAGRDEDAHWKTWLTLLTGLVLQTGNKVTYLTQYYDSLETIWDIDKYSLSGGAATRTDFYLSPGILVGIGNFVVGYRHWIYTDESAVEPGDPARTNGALRIGYRFTW